MSREFPSRTSLVAEDVDAAYGALFYWGGGSGISGDAAQRHVKIALSSQHSSPAVQPDIFSHIVVFVRINC